MHLAQRSCSMEQVPRDGRPAVGKNKLEARLSFPDFPTPTWCSRTHTGVANRCPYGGRGTIPLMPGAWVVGQRLCGTRHASLHGTNRFSALARDEQAPGGALGQRTRASAAPLAVRERCLLAGDCVRDAAHAGRPGAAPIEHGAWSVGQTTISRPYSTACRRKPQTRGALATSDGRPEGACIEKGFAQRILHRRVTIELRMACTGIRDTPLAVCDGRR